MCQDAGRAVEGLAKTIQTLRIAVEHKRFFNQRDKANKEMFECINLQKQLVKKIIEYYNA